MYLFLRHFCQIVHEKTSTLQCKFLKFNSGSNLLWSSIISNLVLPKWRPSQYNLKLIGGDMLFLLAKFQYEFWKSTWPCTTLPKYKVWIVYSKMTALAAECGKRKKMLLTLLIWPTSSYMSTCVTLYSLINEKVNVHVSTSSA